MLFDLRTGKRRRVVQVVYGFLALIFLIGFVGFGIGGDVSFGLADGCGLRDGGQAGTASADLDDAQERVDENPDDPEALRDLAVAHVQVANEAGAQGDAEEVTDQYVAAVDAWNAYLATEPRRPDAGAAGTVIPAFEQTLATLTLADAAEAQTVLDSYAETAGIIAEDNPAQATWLQAAALAHAAGDERAAREATRSALAANDGTLEPGEIRRQLEAAEKQGAALQEDLEKTKKQGGAAGGDLPDQPFGGFGGTGGAAPPGAPAPAP